MRQLGRAGGGGAANGPARGWPPLPDGRGGDAVLTSEVRPEVCRLPLVSPTMRNPHPGGPARGWIPATSREPGEVDAHFDPAREAVEEAPQKPPRQEPDQAVNQAK